MGRAWTLHEGLLAVSLITRAYHGSLDIYGLEGDCFMQLAGLAGAQSCLAKVFNAQVR